MKKIVGYVFVYQEISITANRVVFSYQYFMERHSWPITIFLSKNYRLLTSLETFHCPNFDRLPTTHNKQCTDSTEDYQSQARDNQLLSNVCQHVPVQCVKMEHISKTS
jgi:hypothetical protein